MEQLSQQVTIVVSELEALKAEIITIKGAHASLHQSSVTANAQHEQFITDQASRVASIQKKVDDMARTTGVHKDGKKWSLIEPKNVTVELFHGSVADSRAKFLSWGERVRDKADLMDPQTGEAMLRAEAMTNPRVSIQCRAANCKAS